jgi:hypothetical protein
VTKFACVFGGQNVLYFFDIKKNLIAGKEIGKTKLHCTFPKMLYTEKAKC